MAIIPIQTDNSFYWYIEYSESNVSVANNTSYVSAAFRVQKIASNNYTYNNYNNVPKSVTINGSTFTSYDHWDMRSSSVGTVQTFGAGGVTITHNADGSKSIYISCYFATDTSVSGTVSGGATVALTTIPRGCWVDVNGTWARALCYININGIWQQALPYINVSGTWILGAG